MVILATPGGMAPECKDDMIVSSHANIMHSHWLYSPYSHCKQRLLSLCSHCQRLRLVCSTNSSTHPVQSACSPNNPTQSHIELHNSAQSTHIEPHQAELDERIDEERRKGTIFVIRVGSPSLYSDLQKVILPSPLPVTCFRFTCSDS